MNLDMLVDTAKEKSRVIIEVLQHTHRPMMVIPGTGSNKQVAIVHLEAPPDQLGDMALSVLQKFHASAYIFICEAWIVRGESATEVARGTDIDRIPLDDKQRVLNIVAVEKGKSYRFYTAIIDNLPSGKKMREFQEFQELQGKFNGRMVIRDW